MPITISLKGVAPVAQGLNQNVHQHPGEPDLLIKTLKLEKAERRFHRKLGGLRVKRRHGIYTGWFRELNEYMAVRARNRGTHPPFLQQLYGFVETDIGLGLIVGKVKDREGRLAPKLGEAVQRDGLTPQLRANLLALHEWLNDNSVITNDLSKNNILCGWSEGHGDHLVIIEGLGDHNFIPISRMSRRINVARTNRHFRRIMAVLERHDSDRLAQQNEGSP